MALMPKISDDVMDPKTYNAKLSGFIFGSSEQVPDYSTKDK